MHQYGDSPMWCIDSVPIMQCTNMVLPHCEIRFHNVKLTLLFGDEGVLFKRNTPFFRPPPVGPEAQTKRKLVKFPIAVSIFFICQTVYAALQQLWARQ
jgi:hypothetical protein